MSDIPGYISAEKAAQIAERHVGRAWDQQQAKINEAMALLEEYRQLVHDLQAELAQLRGANDD